MSVATGLHRDSAAGEIHVAHQWEYANASARAAASGFVAGDENKLALQLDNSSFWVLSDYTGPTWVQIGGIGTGTGLVSTIMFTIDNGGEAITTGVKGDLVIDFACTLNAWTLLADVSGAIKIDIWRDTYANYPPTDADSLTNAHEPEIAASGVKAQDTSLGDWTSTAIAAGDILRFNVDSAATITRCLIALKVTRT